MSSDRYPLFCRGDLDGFFGLFVDNLVQLLLIVGLCGACGITPASPLLLHYILPGAATSILLGNLFYAWQAHRLARRENRSDVTAQPYGINTPSLIVYVFFVMMPARTAALQSGASEAEAAEAAWRMGLLACLGSGLIEFAGSFVGARIRQRTPRAALLSTLAGIAIGFISMTFALQIFQRPIVAMLPLAIVLMTYFSGAKFPLALPGGLVAVVAGTLVAWGLPIALPASLDPIVKPAMSGEAVTQAWAARGWYLPQFVGDSLWPLLGKPELWTGYLSVIVPMGLFNVVGSMQNVESAEAAGDAYDTRSSMAVNGLGTIAAALFGSCFPTTIYIGHPGWKGLGARAGYSTLNGVVISLICFTGTVSVISRVIPIEAGVAIVLWIGVIITAQAFQRTPMQHAPAVAVGLFPAIAAWGATVVAGAFDKSGGETIQQLLARDPVPAMSGLPTEVNGFLIHGMIVMERGFIFTCMLLAAISAFLIDRKFYTAACWSVVAAILAFTGLTHAYQIQGNAVDYLFIGRDAAAGASAYPAPGIGVGYLLFALLFALYGRYAAGQDDSEIVSHS